MQNLKHIPIQCETVAEPPDKALDDGVGIIVVAETSTGCLQIMHSHNHNLTCIHLYVQNLKHIPVQCETVAEPPEKALGDGTGIIIVAETSSGCLLGASGIGERGVPAEQIANTAADELIEAVWSGACVDQW